MLMQTAMERTCGVRHFLRDTVIRGRMVFGMPKARQVPFQPGFFIAGVSLLTSWYLACQCPGPTGLKRLRGLSTQGLSAKDF
jgi:hypothetical protein